MPYTPGSLQTSKKRQVSHLFVCLTFYPPSFMWLINIHRAKVGLYDFLYTYCDINETGSLFRYLIFSIISVVNVTYSLLSVIFSNDIALYQPNCTMLNFLIFTVFNFFFIYIFFISSDSQVKCFKK